MILVHDSYLPPAFLIPPKRCYNTLVLSILDQVCIATSGNGTKRCQVIDLVAEGVPEYMLDELKLPIYVCEWLVCPYTASSIKVDTDNSRKCNMIDRVPKE